MRPSRALAWQQERAALSPGAATRERAFSAMVLGICALILAPTLSYRMGVDQGVFAYIAAGLLDGRWPYVHSWESDFPGLMFLQALEILVLGKSLVMFRLFDLIFQLANAYLIYRIAGAVGTRPGAYVAAATYCLIYQGYGPWNTAQREGFGIFFVLLGFWCYLTASRRPPLATASGIGLGLGIAVSIKPTLLALAALYAPLALRLDRPRRWRLGLVATLGLVAPMATIVTLYWTRGGLRDLYEACISYQSIYTTTIRGDQGLLWFWLANAGRLGGQAALLALLYVPFLLWGPARRERAMLYLGYLGSLFAVIVQGTFAGYHYLPGLAVGSILVGTVFSQLSRLLGRDSTLRIGRAHIRAPLLVAHMLVLAAVPIYLRRDAVINLTALRFLERPFVNEFRNGTVFDFTEDFEVAEYLRARTGSTDRVQVWGYESLVYYLAERDASSRFQMTHPLVMRAPGQGITPMQQRWRDEFMRDVRDARPRYVAVVREDNWWWAPEGRTSEELLDDFPEWKRFIEENYLLEQRIGRFLIYRHVDGRSAGHGGSGSAWGARGR